MSVEWTIEFLDPRPLSDIALPASLSECGTPSANLGYSTNYSVVASASTASLQAEDTSSLSATNAANLDLVMQS